MDRARSYGSSGVVPPTGGYSSRRVPPEPKAADRHRSLLTDRGAYISFLEAQAERANAICLETEHVGAGLQTMHARVDELEEKLRNTVKAVELTQDHSVRTGESGRAARCELEDQIRVLESRTQRLELGVGDSRITAEAEMARLRNEVALAVQDLGQRVDERMHAMRVWRCEADEGASGIIREAQATCVRLADDALAAAEVSQRKLDELAQRTEASMQVLQVDLTALKAELAGVTRHSQAAALFPTTASVDLTNPAKLGSLDTNPLASSGAGATTLSDGGTVSEIADGIERRLGARLGQQVLQLSEVLRRVVHAQGTMHQHMSGSSGPSASSSTAAPPLPVAAQQYSPTPVQMPPVVEPLTSGMPHAGSNAATAASTTTEAQRRAAIDDLYEELRRLEDNDAAMKRSTSALASSGRRSKSSRNVRGPP